MTLTCDWQPTGEFDRHGKPYHKCSRCGRRWAFHRLAGQLECGKSVSVASVAVVVSGCAGCGQSSGAKRVSRDVQADYPGAE